MAADPGGSPLIRRGPSTGPAPRARRARRGRRARLVGRYLLLVVTAFVVLVPIWLTVVNSLLPVDRSISYPPELVVTDPQWGNYGRAVRQGSLPRYLLNSSVVSAAITAGQVTTSVLAAYAFAFLRFPLRNLVFLAFLATLMVPTEVTILVNLETVGDLGWLDSYPGLVVPFLATAFGTFLLRQAFIAVPQDLRDAATLDGYGHVGFLARVVVPLARPAIAALAVFSFLLAWNQYLWPLLVTDRDRYRTVQIGLKSLAATNVDELNVAFAGTVIAALPIFAVLVAFQRHLVRGLTLGAIKG